MRGGKGRQITLVPTLKIIKMVPILEIFPNFLLSIIFHYLIAPGTFLSMGLLWDYRVFRFRVPWASIVLIQHCKCMALHVTKTNVQLHRTVHEGQWTLALSEHSNYARLPIVYKKLKASSIQMVPVIYSGYNSTLAWFSFILVPVIDRSLFCELFFNYKLPMKMIIFHPSAYKTNVLFETMGIYWV